LRISAGRTARGAAAFRISSIIRALVPRCGRRDAPGEALRQRPSWCGPDGGEPPAWPLPLSVAAARCALRSAASSTPSPTSRRCGSAAGLRCRARCEFADRLHRRCVPGGEGLAAHGFDLLLQFVIAVLAIARRPPCLDAEP